MISASIRRSLSRSSKSQSDTENVTHESAIDCERKKRRSVYNTENGLGNTSEHNSIAIMDMEQVKSHIKFCQKLFYENKINIHNAWSVRIIDCISRYVSNNKIDAETILVAATTLDICVKVYGYKLEYLGKEIIKLVQAVQPLKANQNDDVIAADNIRDIKPQRPKQKRRKTKCTIAKDRNTLLCKEIPKAHSANFGERHDIYASSSENMSINRISMDHAAFKFKLMNDIDCGYSSYGTNDPTLRDEPFSLTFREVKSLCICPQFQNFNVDSLDDQCSDISTICSEVPSNPNCINKEVVYDDEGFPVPELDGSIHDIFEDNNMDNVEEIGGTGQVVQRAVEMITSLSPINEQVRNACENSTRATSLSCSIWIGPSHWKNKLVRASVAKFSGKSSIEQPPPAKRRKKSTGTTTECEDFNFLGNVAEIIDMNHKITKTLSLNIDKCTLPPNDVCYVPDFDTLNEIALIPTKEYRVTIAEVESDRAPEQNSSDIDLPNINSLEFDGHNGLDMDETPPDNIVEENNNIQASTPIKKARVAGLNIDTQAYVPYAMRAKRVNMKKLKRAMWECLVDKSKPNTITRPIRRSTFSEVYKELPDRLPGELKNSINVPLAFFCLLHLTNEHNLKLTALPNLNDVKIA